MFCKREKIGVQCELLGLLEQVGFVLDPKETGSCDYGGADGGKSHEQT